MMNHQREPERLLAARATLTRGRDVYEGMTELADDPWLTDVISAFGVAIDEIDVALLRSDSVDVAADFSSLVIMELDPEDAETRTVPNSPDGDVSRGTSLMDATLYDLWRTLRQKATKLYKTLRHQGRR